MGGVGALIGTGGTEGGALIGVGIVPVLGIGGGAVLPDDIVAGCVAEATQSGCACAIIVPN